MKRIFNPWEGMEGYHCYGCDPHSPQGLRMEFYEDGDDIVSVWKPRPEFQGWVDTLHGGIQATLADEISSWVVFRKFQTRCKFKVQFLACVLPYPSGELNGSDIITLPVVGAAL